MCVCVWCVVCVCCVCVCVCVTPADTLQTVGVKRRVRRLKKSKYFRTANKTNSGSIRHIKDPYVYTEQIRIEIHFTKLSYNNSDLSIHTHTI